MVAAATAASAVATCYSYIIGDVVVCDGFPFRWIALLVFASSFAGLLLEDYREHRPQLR